MPRRAVPGNAKLLKELNQYQILDCLRIHGSLARSELARLTGLTPPTVGAITAALIKEGLLVEGESMPGKSAGRRAVPLSIDPSAGVAIAILLKITHTQVCAVDLAGKVRARSQRPLPQGVDPGRVAADLAGEVQRLVDDLRPRRVLGVGAGLHGLVEHESGTMRFAPHFGWRDVPFAAMLQEHLGWPVVADNDVRCVALGELWFGAGRGLQNFMCINVGTGIGSGIVLDGRLFRGTSDMAGEIGHVTIDLNGPVCSCGNRGCLETVASGPSIANRAGLATLDEVIRAAARGAPLARQALEEAGTYLGVAIANLVKTLNPQVILIGGEAARAGDNLLRPMHQAIADRAMDRTAGVIPVRPTELGEDAGAIGAAALVLDRFFRGASVPGVLDWMHG